MFLNYKVSIIVPVYNAEKYLNKCVDSILTQTYTNIEVILVDDGSPDNSPRICDDYARKSSNVFVVHKENEGAAIARNVGLKHSMGQYVMFVDADDWIDPEYIETMVSLAKEHEVDVVVSGFKKFHNRNFLKNVPYFNVGYYDKERLIKEIYPQMLSAKKYYTFGFAPSVCGKLFSGELARKQTQYFLGDITQGEDGCFTYSYLLDCNSIYITDNTMYIYRDNPISVSKGFNFKLLNETEKLRNCLESIAKEKQWNIGCQLDEYIAIMCYNITIRALINYEGDFKVLRRHLKKYIKTNFPLKILTNANFIKTATLKMKIMFFLLVIKWFKPMQMALRCWIK